MRWINFLHFYQPANIDAFNIVEATEKSYERIIRALERHPNIKFTINITGCLFLRWEELGYLDLIKRIKKLVDKKQVELTGSAAYHPILPLIPAKEIKWQIKENEKILRKHFGKNFKPQGFFMPEMAFSEEAAEIIKSHGYKWLFLDEIAFNGKLKQIKFNKIFKDKKSGIKIVFRSRKLSKSYVPDTILKLLKANDNPNNNHFNHLAITATDGELYGLRHEDPTGKFEHLLSQKELSTLTTSEYIKQVKEVKQIKPKKCSWESMEIELKQGKPYFLWYDKDNDIQMKLWQLANLAYETTEKFEQDKDYKWARWHLTRGLASCTFWWASAKDFRLFGPISWSPDEIERGGNELIRSIRALDDVTTRETKIKAEKLYIKIKQMVWEKHWTYYWKKA